MDIGAKINERRREGKELTPSGQWFERVADTTPDVIYVLDIATYRVVYSNRRLLFILGYGEEELKRYENILRQVVHPDDLEKVTRNLTAMADSASGEVRVWTTRAIHKDGSIHWIENSVSPFSRGADGRVEEVIGVARDITERVKTEEEMRRREKAFRTLAENAPVGIMRLDAQSTYLYVNREAERIMQSTRDAIIGKKVGMFGMPEKSQIVFRNNILRAIETMNPLSMELTVPRKERAYHYQVRFVPEPADGDPHTVLAIFSDITSLKEIQERLKRAGAVTEKRAHEAEEGRSILEAIMEYIPEGLLVADAETKRIRMISKYVAEYIGIAWERMRGITLAEYREYLQISSAAGVPVKAEQIPVWRSLTAGEIVMDEEYLLKKKNGDTLNVLINTVPIRDQQGRITGAVASWRDISERKKVEETLRRNEHELRTLVDNSPDLIFRLNRQMKYVYANPAYERLTGIPRDRFIGRTNGELGMPLQTEEFWQSAAMKVLGKGREFSVEFDMSGFFGTRYFLARLIPEFAKSGLVDTVLVIARDITERKRAEERIRYISFHDEVTGLFNRAFFEEELRRLDTERDIPVSIIMGDVNNLKLSNDVFGHEEGDRLLRTIADILRKACRQNDIIARWGGDEFAVILPETNFSAAYEEVCRRIKHIVKESKGAAIGPSIALGVATKEKKDQNIYVVIRQAEERMYDNKTSESKKNETLVFESLFARARERNKGLDDHIARTLALAGDCCEEFGLNGNQLEDLLLLVRLHDIGDTLIPAEILEKPGRLSPEEWNVMKKHSEAGLKIVKTFVDTARISEEVYSHGERWDGTGYPRGLRGEQIPYLTRIFQVIDAYDVMTHERPYARAFSREEAVEELRRAAGRQFDPDFVERFLRHMRGPAVPS